MIGSRFFWNKAGQGYICLLVFAASCCCFFTAYSFKAAEKAAIENCSSFLERKGIALGRVRDQQRLLICPPSPRKIMPREKLSPSREGRQRALIKGLASWYGRDGLDGRRTASGELFDPTSCTAAHRSLPFGTKVKVTYLKTGKSIVVRINDRGPSISERIIDLSYAAAESIGLRGEGIGKVMLEILP